jgi:hypothetical protein
MKYVDNCTPEERERRALAAMKEMEKDYNFVPDMTDDEGDYALMKALGTKLEDLPEEEDRKNYAAYLKANP